jgi:ABC-type uncharacterized transport system permease subunit
MMTFTEDFGGSSKTAMISLFRTFGMVAGYLWALLVGSIDGTDGTNEVV